jgi:hypothetical protein
MNTEKTITITLDEYRELVRIAERVETVKRFVFDAQFCSTEDILTALGIKKKESEGDNGQI